MPDRRPGLDDPAQAAFAWARFRRIMRWMGLVALVCIAGALFWLELYYGPLSWVAITATILGVGLSVLLAATLMGLIFLSSGTGHDEIVDEFNEKDRRRP